MYSLKKFRISFAEAATLLLMVTLVLPLFTLSKQNQRAGQVIVEQAFGNAYVLSNFAATAQDHYSNSVQPYATANGAIFTAAPEAFPQRIRFPATYSRILAEDFTEIYPNTSFRIYSSFPFPNQSMRDLDDFADEALAFLKDGEDDTFRRLDDGVEGSRTVRLAVPIYLKESCVACHNDPRWELQKQDWQVGDVRGVREVSITIPHTELNTASERTGVFLLVLMSCALCVFGVYPAVKREVKQRAHYRSLSGELNQAAQRFKTDAQTDALTGLSNRRHFDEALNDCVIRAQGDQSPFALVIFDIDHFKQVNDAHGHVVGDDVIRKIGSILNSNLRKGDVAARIGGEEFAILTWHLAFFDVVEMVERLRSAISSAKFAGNSEFSVTISAGLVAHQDSESATALYQRADALLYQAKNSGRNKACADPSLTS